MRVSLFVRTLFALLLLFGAASLCFAQTETATISGRVTDPSGAVVVGARVTLQSADRGTMRDAVTNGVGVYLFSAVPPGVYHITVQTPGFRTVSYTALTANVQAHIEQNFLLEIGSASESVSVIGDGVKIKTTDVSVSTVVDRTFAENLPLNGRSMQSLLQLTPGIVLTGSSGLSQGTFSVNGQRSTSNYLMVDGVSANTGVAASFAGMGTGASGSTAALSSTGGTNSLVSVDAMQEFRIQTSTYAPEFGRFPGAQISIVTRSGTSRFRGTVFEYFRHDALDANDWFANRSNLKKPELRVNDFGGTFSGPIIKDRTFFFFSYEGQRLRLPQTGVTTVPSITARQNALPALKPFFDMFPVPKPGASDVDGVSPFEATFSNQSTLDATSLRIDQSVRSGLTLFARYNYSPSETLGRGGQGPLSFINAGPTTIHTATAGLTWTVSPRIVNDLRVNYSYTRAERTGYLDTFGGAVPATFPFPAGRSEENSLFTWGITSLLGFYAPVGRLVANTQRQMNIVDSVSWQKGTHTLKFGVDFRQLTPVNDSIGYSQTAYFRTVSDAQLGGPMQVSNVNAGISKEYLLRNLGAFAQDTWRTIPRLTLTYGIRWDVEFAPTTSAGPKLPAAANFDIDNLKLMTLAPEGTPAFDTSFANFAPRAGAAYQLFEKQDWETVLRGGFGVFSDIATQELGVIHQGYYPFANSRSNPGATFPLAPALAAPSPIVKPGGGSGTLSVFDPDLKLPYTLQWNIALEQGLGKSQTVSVSYVGSAGRRLTDTAYLFAPAVNPEFSQAFVVTNAGTSDYKALQVQFQRRLSRGLQALASYTWAESLDTASSSQYGQGISPGTDAQLNRGPSSFDIRHSFSAAATYIIPARNMILRGWSLQHIFYARSAPPVTATIGSGINGVFVIRRPNLVPGIPLYLYGDQYPGGKAFNNTPNQGGAGCKGPFCPPSGTAQGNMGRNALRGFGSYQWDMAVHREFPIGESLKLQFRAEVFNVLNHPNFGPPNGLVTSSGFGLATTMLNRSYNGDAAGSGGLTSLFQGGGPRSIQLGVKLLF